MISCTEFIPLYSELFCFLHETRGYEAVLAYWDFIASRGICNRENKNSLISFLERSREDPFEGAWRYWEMTTGEEACDLMPAYSAAMNLLGCRGRFHQDYCDPYTEETLEEMRRTMQSIGELA